MEGGNGNKNTRQMEGGNGNKNTTQMEGGDGNKITRWPAGGNVTKESKIFKWRRKLKDPVQVNVI
jgi:hypothetical protein